MKPDSIDIRSATVFASLAIIVVTFGCASPVQPNAPPAASAPPAPGKIAQASGAELWARNCGHCHNIRSPASYSDAQWEVAVMHMRVRANLTAEEHKQILAFLKSAH